MREPYRRAGASAEPQASADDPLAELARLIGQSDPFAEFGQQTPPQRGAAAASQPRPPQRASETYMPAPAREPAPARRQVADEDSDPGYHPGTFDSRYVVAQEDRGYEADTYDDQGEPDEDDDYDEPLPPRRRGGLAVVAAILCLAVVGTAGAFAYRSFVSGLHAKAGPAPIIKADAAPAKIVPAVQASESANSKLIYDRIGMQGQSERVVPREEQPVDVKPVTSRTGIPAAGEVTASAGGPLPVYNEPKRVRTVVIRADGPEGSARSGDGAPRENTRVASAGPQRVASPSTASPARTAAPPPMSLSAQNSAPAVAAPARPSSGPLSLAPQAASEAPRGSAQEGTRVAAATPVASAPAAGGYLVQIASQRSEADARTSFHNLQTKYPRQLGSYQPIIRRADLGQRGTYFRSMVGPFASAEQANDFCGSLKSAGGSCIVQRN